MEYNISVKNIKAAYEEYKNYKHSGQGGHRLSGLSLLTIAQKYNISTQILLYRILGKTEEEIVIEYVRVAMVGSGTMFNDTTVSNLIIVP